MKKRVSVFVMSLLGILTLNTSHAQRNYHPGKVITNDGTVLNGLIDYREWDKNPISFHYKATVEAAIEQTFTIKEVKYFEVGNTEYFERYTVDISLGGLEISDQLRRLADTMTKQETVFLRVLRKGMVADLYAYVDNIKTRYYILEHAAREIPMELLVRTHSSIQNGGQIITNEIYKTQLYKILHEHKKGITEKLLPEIQHLQYTQSSLSKFIDHLNGPDGKVFPPIVKKARIAPYAGINIFAGKAKYTGYHELTENAQTKASVLPGISAGLDFFINPNVKRTKLRLDLSFLPAQYDISKTKGSNGGFIKHSFGLYSFAFSPQVIYNFYKSNRLGLNLGCGLTASYSIHSNSIYEMHYTDPGPGGSYNYKQEIKLEPFSFSLPIRAGILIGSRFDIYAQYNVALSPVSSFVLYSIKINSGMVGINFLF
jgi:hypothetical protein